MKKDYLSSLKFDNYLVKQIEYKHNENFGFSSKILDVDFSLSAKISIDRDSAGVTLVANIGDSTNENCPYTLTCSIVGYFTFETIQDNELLETLLTTNAVAIMFPYLREIISDTTQKSNIFPAYTLPLINVVELLKDKDSIVIEYTRGAS